MKIWVTGEKDAYKEQAYHGLVGDRLDEAIDNLCKRLCRQLGPPHHRGVSFHAIFPHHAGLFHGWHAQLWITSILNVLLGTLRYFAKQIRKLLVNLYLNVSLDGQTEL